MGDVAMLVQAVHNALKSNSELKITLVTRPQFQVFFGRHERLSFHTVDLKGKHKGLPGLLKLASELSSLRPGFFVDMHDVLRSKIVRSRMKLAGIKTIAFDKGRKEKTAMLQGKTVFRQLPHSIERYNDALKKNGIKIDENFHFTLPTSSHEFKIKPKTKVIGIAPFAAHESKEWGIENVRALIKLLNDSGSYEVLLFGGGKREVKLIKDLTYDFSCIRSVAGQFSLEEELSIMRSCHVFVAMDSSNMHLADLVDCSVISIWIATHPNFGFYAWNNRDNSIVLSQNKYKEIPLSIFGKLKSANDMAKVVEIRKLITPEMVFERISDLLNQASSNS